MGSAGDYQNKEIKKITDKEDEENHTIDDDEQSEIEDLDPKPVVVVKFRKALEKRKQHQLSSESDDVILDGTPLNSYLPADFDVTQSEPALKKRKIWGPKAPTTPAPTRTKTPTGLCLKIIGPKPPEPKLCKPRRVMYIHDGPDQNPACDGMGHLPEPRTVKTPYETVRDALTFLKIESGISTEDCEEMSMIKDGAEYSISRVTPYTLFSMDEVVMELDLFLNSMPETTSSDVMKERLLEFQTRLGLPPHPDFYNLMWTSPEHFMHHLDFAQQDLLCAVTEDKAGNNNGGTERVAYGNDDGMTDRTSGHNRAVWVNEETAETSCAFGVRYDRLPPPFLPFFDAIEILHEFVNIIENEEDFVLDEKAFFNLEFDLLLPEWFSLYELYKERFMAGVVHFIHDYFQTSQIPADL